MSGGVRGGGSRGRRGGLILPLTSVSPCSATLIPKSRRSLAVSVSRWRSRAVGSSFQRTVERSVRGDDGDEPEAAQEGDLVGLAVSEPGDRSSSGDECCDAVLTLTASVDVTLRLLDSGSRDDGKHGVIPPTTESDGASPTTVDGT